MPKPRIQFSLKTLLIITLLASAVLGIAVSMYVERRNGIQRIRGEWAVSNALNQCHRLAEVRLNAILRMAEFSHFKSKDLDYLINKWIDKRGGEIEEDLVDLHLHLAQSYGRLTCEITINGGRESEAFVNDLRAQLEKTGIAVSVREP